MRPLFRSRNAFQIRNVSSRVCRWVWNPRADVVIGVFQSTCWSKVLVFCMQLQALMCLGSFFSFLFLTQPCKSPDCLELSVYFHSVQMFYRKPVTVKDWQAKISMLCFQHHLTQSEGFICMHFHSYSLLLSALSADSIGRLYIIFQKL